MLVIVLTASGFVLLWKEPVRIDPSDSNQVALGKQLYATACASCHATGLAAAPSQWPAACPPA